MRHGSLTLLSTAALLLTLPGLPALAGDISAAPPVSYADRQKPVRVNKVIPLTPEQIRAEMKQLQADLILKPNDAQLHYKLGESYRKQGDNERAAAEYALAIKNDSSLWVAYHQLSLTCNDDKQIDEAIEKLLKLETEKPRELLLRVALSELFEKRGNYYQAARTLIDLTYANAVPEKFRPKVTSRIHNMLSLAKSQHQESEAPKTAIGEEELDVMPAPPPMPAPGSKRSIAHAKLKDSKEVRGMGHTPLLP
ncbi:MAG: hypothetical protein K2X27_12295 [Candidatus Obscuribacterales bacterium]|nr:hypothetical protein [Candidatus Obscuribacterales bacterium]